MFPSGHGWTGNGTGSFSDAGGELILNIDRSYKIETNGSGGTSVATSPALTAIDLNERHVVFHSMCSFSNRMKTVKLRLASGNIASDYAEVTIWDEDSDPIALQSTFERQSFLPDQFAETGTVDWSAIDSAQIRVTDDTSGKFTLYVAGIYAVPTRSRSTVSFCFDDGFSSVYANGLEKLSQYRFPATAYVITDILGDEGQMTLAQLDTVRDQHDWEIAGHAFTIDAHNEPSGLDSLEGAALEAELDRLKGWLDEHGFRRASFAYPKGSAGEEVRALIRRDYGAGRATARGPETVPPRDDYTLRGWSINGTNTLAATVKSQIDAVVADGGWLILTFHKLVEGSPATATEFQISAFDEVVDHVRTRQLEKADLKVRTVADAMEARPPGNGGADLAQSGKGFVVHGATASTPRPPGFGSIEWQGSVEPENAIDGDTWIEV